MKMDNRKIIYWIVIASLIILSLSLSYFVLSKSRACLTNPLVYGVAQYHSNSVGEFTCTCSAPNTNQIYVTKDNISLLRNYNG